MDKQYKICRIFQLLFIILAHPAQFMRNPILFIVFSICISTFSFAQEYQISGNVKNTEGITIAFANVLLLKATDSTVIKGTSTNEKGEFTIDRIVAGTYVLTASFIENSSKPIAVEVLFNIAIGTLIIDETARTLDEVIVTYQKPKLERKADRLVFNVANSTLSEGNIWDLLKYTPTVTDIQGELTIKGSSNIGVMINGRKINLPKSDIINLLSGSSASNVESIEVITNPPAKYSAEGGMLINIKTSKNLVAGYNGAIYNNYTQGVFAKHTVGTDHYFKGNKTAFSVNYSFSNDKQISRYTDIINFPENSTPASIWTANQDFITKRKRHNLSAFFDYTIDTKNTLSLSTINTFNPDVNRFYDTSTLITDTVGSLLSSFDTTNDSNQDQLNTSFYMDWIHQLNKKGAEVSVNTHYTFLDSDLGQDLKTDFFDVSGNLTGENNFTTLSQQQINLYSIQADYTSPLGKSSRIETGLRYAGIDSKNTISQEGFDRNQPGINPTEAGVFIYNEAIYAAYGSFNTTWDLWKLKSGLRAEYTDTTGDLDTALEQNNNSYLEFFPSFSLQYIPSDEHEFTLNYFRRIYRPRYNSINPFQYFQSNNVVTEGNPNLLPATRNYIGVGYTYKNDYTIELYYENQKNKNRQQIFQDNSSNLLRFISSNLDTSFGYGLDAYMDKDFTNSWNFYVFVSAYYNEDSFRDLDSDLLLENGLWSWFVNTNNSFTILEDKSLKVDVRFSYFSPKIFGNTRRESYNELNVSLRKTFWKKKASISLGIVDIFNQGSLFSTRNFLNQNNTSSYRPENRLFKLGFRYKFGNVKIKGNKKSKRIAERKRI